jgi:glycosyltransferase involved in cell wall biosynthesis
MVDRVMRVLHVIPSIGLARGGPSVVVRTLAQAQAEQGIQVHVAATDDDGPDRRGIPPQLPYTERQVTYWIFPRQTRYYLFSFPLTRWLMKHVSEYDVVHIHALFSYSSVAAAVAASMAGVPYIVRPLGTLSAWSMKNRRRWLKRLSFRLIESRILRAAAAVHYTSTQELTEAENLCIHHRGVMIPNPVSLELIKSRPRFANTNEQRKGVLFLSRLDPKKGLDLLLPAFAEVRARFPEVVLVIAGEGEPAFVAALKLHAQSLGLDRPVSWVGFLQGEPKRAALEEADVFVLPSYSENFGVSVVEAMAAGLPVVISDQVGIHQEIESAQAGLVTTCDVKSLARALTEVLGDPIRRTEMGENAAKLAQTFAPEIVAQQLRALYTTISRERRESRAA